MSEPAPVTLAPGWVSVHVFHAGPLGVLLVDAVAPLVGALTGAGLIDGYFFLRYWEGGPHLRLRLRPAGGQPEPAEVRRLVTERLCGYLATHPSIRQLTAQQYAALADQLAAGEALSRYEGALRPNDSIDFIAYLPEHDWYGGAESLAAVERHFVESSELALRLLNGATPPPRRTAQALALLILTVAVSEPDLDRAAEWFTTQRVRQNLAAADPASGDLASGDLAAFEAGYRQRRPALLRQTVRLWEAAGGPIDLDRPGAPNQDTLTSWLRSVRRLHTRLSQLRTQGHFPPPEFPFPGFRPPTPSASRPPVGGPQVAGPDAITLVLSRCAHLLCNRLGLSLTDEAYLRFLLARALTDLSAGPTRTGFTHIRRTHCDGRPIPLMTPTSTDPTESSPGAVSWYSVHVHYHDPLDDLILDAARPLFDRLDPAVVPQAYWVRHWRRGPHLRLNLRTTPQAWTERVWPTLDGGLHGYLAAHPATTVLDEQAETPRHQRLAEHEWELGPLSPWRPNNSVQVEPYDPRLHALGGQVSADLLADFHTDATELAFAMLAAVRGGAPRLSLALNLMFAYAQVTVPEGIRRGYMSYFSHATGYLSRCEDPVATRAAFDQCYQDNRDRLAAQLAAVLDTVNSTDGTGPAKFVPQWLELVRRYRERAEPLIASRAITFDHLADQPTPRAWAEARASQPPHVVARLGDNEAWQREIGDSDWFRRHRLQINYQYLLLNRLGITPRHRYLLCHLAASTVQEVFGVSTASSFEEFMATHPNAADAQRSEGSDHATTSR